MNEEELILTHILDCERIHLYVDPQPLTHQQEKDLSEIRQRRKHGVPLQYILGRTRFLDIDLKVSEQVLIPRPETELLVDAIIKEAGQNMRRPLRILDLGTGCGNIAISLAGHIPNCNIEAIDISADAITIAWENALTHQVADKISFKQGCLLEFLNRNFADDKKFDIIVSNPPYIANAQMELLQPEVKQEPRIALWAGEDGLWYLRQIIQKACLGLKHNGILALEFGDGQRPALEDIFRQTGCYSRMDFGQDYTLTDRYVLAG